MYKNIYLGLMDIVMNANIGIEHFEWYNRQDETERGKLPFKRPAVFIEFLPTETMSLGHRIKKIQPATVRFRAHLVTDNYYESRHGSSNQDDFLAHQDLLDKLNAKLLRNGYTITQDGEEYVIFNSITRTNVIPDHNFQGLIRTVQVYKCQAWDYSAYINLTVPDPIPGLKVKTSMSNE